jgi:hypothetical protein
MKKNNNVFSEDFVEFYQPKKIKSIKKSKQVSFSELNYDDVQLSGKKKNVNYKRL